jgi:hypothetical protein
MLQQLLVKQPFPWQKRLVMQLIISTLLFAFILCTPVCAAQIQQTNFFRFQADNTQIPPILLQNADAVAQEMINDLGLPLQKPVDVIIAATAEEFQRIQPGGSRVPAWAIGVAYPQQNLIILLSPAVRQRGPIDIIKTFQHEVLHIILGQAFKGKENVPRWLDEGLAMIAANEWSMAQLSTMTFAVLGRKTIPMQQLTESFPWDPDQAHIAYCQSFYFISFLKGRFGSAFFKTFLQNYTVHKNFQRAIFDTYNVRWEEMEELWRDYLRLRFSWIPLITSSTTLWFLATLIFILGYLRKKRMNRLKLKQWTREEEFLYPPDDKPYH